MNESLRQALAQAQLDEHNVAASLGVDPKTVKRWLAGRVPYPRHRSDLAILVGATENDLWPGLANCRSSRARLSSKETPAPEILTIYPHRWAVPREAWERLFTSARREIGILVYSGLFLAEDVGVQRVLMERARAGVTVRILVGDQDSPHVANRGADEGVDSAIAAKIRNALVLYRPLQGIDGVEIRIHQTILYTSIYRADDELLINPHIYGVAASQAPVLHLRRTEDGGMPSTYIEGFERVWSQANALGS